MEAFPSPRLRMRAWTHAESDVDRMRDTYSRPEVYQWLGATPRPLETLDQAHAAVDRWARRQREPFGVWAVEVRDTGVVAGTVLLVPLPDPEPGQEPVEVGWHFHPDSWGQGYATEAARAALDHGFEHGLDEVFAVVRPANVRSLAVCRRLGMTAIGLTSRWYGVEMESFRIGRPVG
jgi:RimJ/RimL family protein N-acetyltransferase